jgi:hypothetical protein
MHGVFWRWPFMRYKWETAAQGVRELEATPHVHIHYLVPPQEQMDRGTSTIEMCCHGCGVGQLVHYDVPRDDIVLPMDAIPELSDFRDDFQKIHSSCPITPVTDDCPRDRTIMTTMDLREVPESPGTEQECDCVCHIVSVVHEDPCCEKCLDCGRNILLSFVLEHAKWCNPAPTIPDCPFPLFNTPSPAPSLEVVGIFDQDEEDTDPNGEPVL